MVLVSEPKESLILLRYCRGANIQHILIWKLSLTYSISTIDTDGNCFPFIRNMERYNTCGYQDLEAWDHVPRGFPPGSSGHEETETRKAGSALRRGI